MKTKLSVRGPGLKELQAFAKAVASSPSVRMGVLGDQHVEGSDLTMAELAAIHEFGAPRANIPERSFLRSTADKHRMAWLLLLQRTMKAIKSGRLDLSVFQALEIVGEKAVADIRATIRAGIAPALAESTIARKGSTLPLVDTGRMLQSITFEVVKEGRK